MSIQTEHNFAKNYNFRLIIPELPIVSSLAQDFLLPALTVNPAEVPNRFVDYGIPGEKIVYSELDIGFLMDSNMDAYIEIHNWMRLMAGAVDQPAEQRRELLCDTTLFVLNNSKNLVRRFIFSDCWPTSLGAVAFDLLASETVKSILSLKFTAFTVDPPSSDLSMFTDKSYVTDVT